MTGYVDGFVLPLPRKNLKAYRSLAAKAGRIWRKHGALQYFECVGDDLNLKWSSLKFKRMAKAKPGETVLFSFIMYKSRAHRDRVNAKVMKDPAMNYQDMPILFDMKRMACGGFKVLVKI